MRSRVTMLYEVNFLDWRNAKRRSQRARWVVIMIIFVLGVSGLEYQRWQVYCLALSQQNWRYSQAQSALKMVMAKRQSWQNLAEQQGRLKKDVVTWKKWLDDSQQPLLTMNMIKQATPSTVYLDSMSLLGRELSLQGIVDNEWQGARFANALQIQPMVEQVYQFRIESNASRWQQSFHPFQLQITLVRSLRGQD